MSDGLPIGVIHFEVRGLPVPQGSSRGFYARAKGAAKGRVIVTSDNRNLADWRRAVAYAAQPVAPAALWDGPIEVALDFRLPQPKSRPTHAGRGKARHPILVFPDRIPDLDKLVRAALDALTNVVWVDDSRVVGIEARKSYGVPGLTVHARLLLTEPDVPTA